MAGKVIVAGAGIIGASIAWRLAQSGVEVVLADAGKVGGEASWAGAGMLTLGAEMPKPGPWQSLGIESLSEYPDFIAELRTTGHPIDFRACGGIQLAKSAQQWHDLKQSSEWQRKTGIPSVNLTALEVAELVPGIASDGIDGALFYPNDAAVEPRDVMAALKVACIKLGVTVLEGVRVHSIRGSLSGVEVAFDTGIDCASAAVIAAGAWSTQITIDAPGAFQMPRAYPIRGHIAMFEYKLGAIGPIVRHGHTYLVQRADGRLLAGSTEEDAGFNRGINVELVDDIVNRAAGLFPALASVEPVETWMGFRPATDARTPEIRRVDGFPLWLAYGHYRNGILLAPATARHVAKEIIAALAL